MLSSYMDYNHASDNIFFSIPIRKEIRKSLHSHEADNPIYPCFPPKILLSLLLLKIQQCETIRYTAMVRLLVHYIEDIILISMSCKGQLMKMPL